LNAIGGVAANDVWAAGDGVVLHWDGSSWQPALTDSRLLLVGVWSGVANDVWIAGYDGDGDSGILLHWDGASWQASETASMFWAVWGVGARDLWVGGSASGGESGFLFHGDGNQFADAGYPGGSVRAIWGQSSDEIWVAQYQGALQRWNGLAWDAFATPDGAILRALAGSGPDDVWAGGADAVMLHWDGAAWRTVQVDIDGACTVSSICSFAADDAWANGCGGLIHWAGSSWQRVRL